MYSHLYLMAYLPIRWPLGVFRCHAPRLRSVRRLGRFCRRGRTRSPATAREELTIDMDAVAKPWTGDLDGMIERGMIRVLTTYSKTFYFMNKGVQRGLTYDAFQPVRGGSEQEDWQKAKKLKQKHIKVRVVFVAGGPGRVAAGAGGRQGRYRGGQSHRYSGAPEAGGLRFAVYSNVSELLVSGPASPAVASVDDLAREGGLRAQVLQLLRKPGGAQPAPRRGEQAWR